MSLNCTRENTVTKIVCAIRNLNMQKRTGYGSRQTFWQAQLVSYKQTTEDKLVQENAFKKRNSVVFLIPFLCVRHPVLKRIHLLLILTDGRITIYSKEKKCIQELAFHFYFLPLCLFISFNAYHSPQRQVCYYLYFIDQKLRLRDSAL